MVLRVGDSHGPCVHLPVVRAALVPWGLRKSPRTGFAGFGSDREAVDAASRFFCCRKGGLWAAVARGCLRFGGTNRKATGRMDAPKPSGFRLTTISLTVWV